MFPATPAPALDGAQGEGEAVADGATGELDSATATAPMVGAAAAVEAMKAEGGGGGGGGGRGVHFSRGGWQ